jgi:hypothetical protein
MFKYVAVVGIVVGSTVGLVALTDGASQGVRRNVCGGWRTYTLTPASIITPAAGCNMPTFGHLTNGDNYTVYPSGKVVVW